MGGTSKMSLEGGAALSKSLRRAAEAITEIDDARPNQVQADRARSYAPKVTGNLARSIEPLPDSEGGGVYASAAYAAVIEFGSAQHNIEPQPYLQPGITTSADVWLPIYNAEVEAMLANTIEGA